MVDREHVVMVVGNAVAPDNRVRKSARTLLDAGYRVTLVGLGSGGSTVETDLDGVRVLHVPVRFTQRDLMRPSVNRAAARWTRPLDAGRADLLLQRARLQQRVLAGDAALDRLSGAGLGAAARKVWRALLYRGLGAGTRVVELRRRSGKPDAKGRKPVLPRVLRRWDAGPLASRPTVEFAEILDYERVFGPLVDTLDPDYVHAHDVYMLGLAARAVARAGARGKTVGLMYDAHEFTPGLAHYTVRRISAMSRHEAGYIHHADVVTTVSEPIADRMQEVYGLAERPSVVHNTPPSSARDVAVDQTLRDQLGLDDQVPIVVYSGNVGNRRGELTLVQALAYLPPDVHVALVTNATDAYLAPHRAAAAAAGAADRFHVLPYVSADHVVSYLSGATVGYHGLAPGPANHEMALPNKLYEYLHAGLPVVVSQAKALRDFVQEHGVGESFRTNDPAHLAEVVGLVLADRERYVKPLGPGSELLARYCWETDARTIVASYERMRQKVAARR